jgi:uncharacterized protein YbjT (DUF2867 family)
MKGTASVIIVTGANGHLGRGVVEQLLKLVPAEQVGVTVRDPEQAAGLASQGVSVRRGDFSDPDGLAAAFAGAERVLIISTDVVGPVRVQLHQNAVDAAKRAGVPHILYTSIFKPDAASPFVPTADHVATEEYVRASGLRWTFLRNSIYMEIVPAFVGAALAGASVDGPADGPMAYAARADLAEATARVLASGGYLDEALELTTSEAEDLDGLAAIVGRITGRRVERRTLSDSAYREQLVAAGFPAAGADVFLSIFAASREGRFSPASPTLGQILGREPIAVEAFLRSTAPTTIP